MGIIQSDIIGLGTAVAAWMASLLFNLKIPFSIHMDVCSLGRSGAFLFQNEAMDRYIWLTINRSTGDFLIYLATSSQVEISIEGQLVPRIQNDNNPLTSKACILNRSTEDITGVAELILDWLLPGVMPKY